MDEIITNKKKKAFLKWLTKNHQLETRESLWILDFLYGHDSMLQKTHFVEQVDQTPRGIYMTTKRVADEGFYFYKNGHISEDPVKAFHEVRLNWSSDLYVEIAIENIWSSPQYLAVLEDNPYARWNDQITTEEVAKMESALLYSSLESKRDELLDKINQLLMAGDREGFERLTKQLDDIEDQMVEITLRD